MTTALNLDLAIIGSGPAGLAAYVDITQNGKTGQTPGDNLGEGPLLFPGFHDRNGGSAAARSPKTGRRATTEFVLGEPQAAPPLQPLGRFPFKKVGRSNLGAWGVAGTPVASGWPLRLYCRPSRRRRRGSA